LRLPAPLAARFCHVAAGTGTKSLLCVDGVGVHGEHQDARAGIPLPNPANETTSVSAMIQGAGTREMASGGLVVDGSIIKNCDND
jgi:hypothetical protein